MIEAYPDGQSWELLTGELGECPQALENIRSVGLPHSDLVFGAEGAALTRWPG